jgi:hypothetical protein
VAGESIAAGVGAGIAGQARFRPVAAWAWMWRNFDAVLPDGDPPTKDGADQVSASGRPLPLRPATVLAVAGRGGDEGLPLP